MEVFSFFGADAKVGTTMICQTVAGSIAAQFPDKKIGLMHFDGNPGITYCQKKFTAGLDELKAAIMSNVLTREELLSACSVTPENLYQLKGICDFSRRRIFTPEAAAYLISLEVFDIAIIDCGSNFEMPLALGAVQYGANNYLVVTQQASLLERYQAMKTQILDPLQIKFSNGVINKIIAGFSVTSADEIKQYYGFDRVVALPYSEYGWQCEKDRMTLLEFEAAEYRKEIGRLTDQIAQMCGYPVKEELRKNRWLHFGR